MVGHFTTSGAATTQLGFTGGIIIAAGNAADAIGPNNSGSNGAAMGTGSDPDLQLLIPAHTVYDKAILEFDFVPISDTVRFRYVFGSEEFDEFCNSNYNDVFGFFISGPGINGPFSNNSKNIALMPNIPTNYVTIDNVCSAGAAYSWLNTNGVYYQYDRLTNVYTAWSIVQPCQQYHIKLAVGDAGDQIYDSGVFLEANSFSSSGLSYNISYSSFVDTVAVEGCNDAVVKFKLGQPSATPLVIHYTISGTAIEGVDYPLVPDSLIIPPGQDSAYFIISPIQDGIVEPTETVKIAYVNTVCGTIDTILILIKDYTPIQTTTTPDVNSCNGQDAIINVNATGGFNPLSYVWSNSAGNTATVNVNPILPTMYYVTVSDACNYSAIDSVKVSISNLSTIITNVDSISCYGYTDGSATVLPSNGLLPYSYIWSPTNDITATVNNLAVGTYFVTVTDDIGCFATNFVILNSPPQILLTLSPTDETCVFLCDGEIATQLTGNYNPPVSYLWNTLPSQSSPNVANLCAGDYTVTVTYSPNNCQLTETATIETETLIYAYFTTDPNPPEGYVPFTISFNSTGTSGATSYSWDFGDGTPVSNETNPTHDYPSMGNYTVTLTVSSGAPNNCISTYQIVVIVIQPSSITIPNVFTPNGDGWNDFFTIEAQGVETINIDIFNRWGKKVFNLNATDFAEKQAKIPVWDGTSKSEGNCADGTYFYVIDAVGYDKKEYNLQGTINLLR
jgi:gliding motility-associated-like protein